MEHLRITVAGKVYDVIVEQIEGAEAVPSAVRTAVPAAARPVAKPVAKPTPMTAVHDGNVTSPLAGLVQAIALDIGAAVTAGDLVITLEAMKMYTPINAPTSGTIQAIHVKVGDAVEEGQVLYTIG
jgi:biotin carboxyl carrier protein